MIISCSVRSCSRIYRWRFGHINLCQGHWEKWCRSTWEALVANLEQPIMEDWVAVVDAGQATDTFAIRQVQYRSCLIRSPKSPLRFLPPEG